MATAAKTTPQDLPPNGGYAPFNTERIKLRPILSGRTAILGYLAATAAGLYIHFHGYKAIKKHEVEMRSAKIAMFPLLLAERDREFLKQLNRNRKDEAELMKDVEGWEVGTFFGYPIYKTVKEDTLVPPSCFEYYAHTSPENYRNFVERAMWT